MGRLFRWAITLSGLGFAWFFVAVIQADEPRPNYGGAMAAGMIWVWGCNALWTDAERFLRWWRNRRSLRAGAISSGAGSARQAHKPSSQAAQASRIIDASEKPQSREAGFSRQRLR
jgi:hypothetical protein